MAGRERPATMDDLVGSTVKRQLRETGDGEPEPRSDEDLWRDRPSPSGSRHQRQGRKAACDEDHAARDALNHTERSRPQPSDRDRRQRHDRDDDAGGGRRHPPPFDEEQDDEEERGDEPARDEEQRCVCGDRWTSGRSRDRSTGDTSRREQQEEGKGHLREEDRLPAQ